jgi:diguanylate cyclase (GGDEF)-like protein
MKISTHSRRRSDADRRRGVGVLAAAGIVLVVVGFVIGHYIALEGMELAIGLNPNPSPLARISMLIAMMSGAASILFLAFRVFVERWPVRFRNRVGVDPLTGLADRAVFQEKAEVALAEAIREGGQFAIFFVALDAFRRVNDTLGHGGGDALLRLIADRLVGIIRLSDSIGRLESVPTKTGIARMGGDEFTLLLTGLSGAADATVVATRVLEGLATPFKVDIHQIVVSATIGIAMYPKDGADIENLMKDADAAMHRAKLEGRNSFRFFTPASSQLSERRLDIEMRLRLAIGRRELAVHYQPVSDVRTGRVVGAEALLRWNNEELGSISPAEFIPIAEDSGLIDELGTWVLRVACHQSRKWQDEGFKSIRMAVNLSGYQVRKARFVDMVEQVLLQTGLGAAELELEITESTIMQDDPRVDLAFQSLRKMGIGLALDDFGTGYSSLSHLRRFPISRVKIDRSFVHGIPDDNANLEVTAAIISMAHHLSLPVVAEGVETQEEAHSLCDLDCDEVQGYLISRPVAATEFIRFLERRTLQPAGPIIEGPEASIPL